MYIYIYNLHILYNIFSKSNNKPNVTFYRDKKAHQFEAPTTRSVYHAKKMGDALASFG